MKQFFLYLAALLALCSAIDLTYILATSQYTDELCNIFATSIIAASFSFFLYCMIEKWQKKRQLKWQRTYFGGEVDPHRYNVARMGKSSKP